jgi:ribonuclease HI
MLHKPILSGRMGKWVYALVEYDLACESSKSMKGQIVEDFIVEHQIDDGLDLEVGYITCTSWKLYSNGSVCDDGQGIGAVLISLNDAIFDMSNQLDEDCTNNQVEYEALLFGLEVLQSLGVKHVKTFGDSLLVVQQVPKVCQCYNGSLNAYLDKCLDIISCFDEFLIRHIPREDNGRANALAQQASGYAVVKKYFHIQNPMRVNAKLQVLDEPVRPVGSIGLTV